MYVGALYCRAEMGEKTARRGRNTTEVSVACTPHCIALVYVSDSNQ